MNDTTRELGGALGVAVLGSLVASRYDSELRPALAGVGANLRPMAEPSLSGALSVANQVGGSAGVQLNLAARDAYVSGMTMAVLIGAVVAFLAAVLVYRLLPDSRHAPAMAAGPAVPVGTAAAPDQAMPTIDDDSVELVRTNGARDGAPTPAGSASADDLQHDAAPMD